MKTETETGVMQPQAKECSQPPEAGRGKKQVLPQGLWWEHSPADAPISAQ